ncbi:MAG: hypothetical protein AAFN77_08205 [Planctomycetota bacterium]
MTKTSTHQVNEWLYRLGRSVEFDQRLKRLWSDPHACLAEGPLTIHEAPYWRSVLVWVLVAPPIFWTLTGMIGAQIALFVTMLFLVASIVPWRKAKIVLTSDQVEFWLGRRSIVCPWAVIDADGHAVEDYSSGNAWFRLPICVSQVEQIHSLVRGNLQTGKAASNSMVRIMVDARQLHIKKVFELPPQECGQLIHEIARVFNPAPPDHADRDDDQNKTKNDFRSQAVAAIAPRSADTSNPWATVGTLERMNQQPGVVEVPITALKFTRNCVCCGRTTRETKSVAADYLEFGVLSRGVVNLVVPMCPPCRGRYTRRAWTLIAFSVICCGVLGGIAGGALSWYASDTLVERLSFAVFGAFIVTVFFARGVYKRVIKRRQDFYARSFIPGGMVTLYFKNNEVAERVRERSGQ